MSFFIFRCVFTTIDPKTGVKDPGMQPLKKLRQFRLAPEGPMRQQFKDSPIFGVNAGVDKPVGCTAPIHLRKWAVPLPVKGKKTSRR
ncbi:hypothetical protein OESDEN_08368 [Oesophagostomum dentatum]|uniref:Uncharacterized protein n=1 Tax=Oesophagostomum dentatum TaxID=61180 RepID=A0A0B1T3E5_OESDE|nr:hypothetical protein OESDEN_08368 [Oesophagostomum dentatum]